MRVIFLFVLILVMGLAHAQNQLSTPIVKTSAPESGKVPFMFVQTAESGTFDVQPNGAGFKLTLRGVSPQTVYFSDRPERVAGGVANKAFLDGLGFSNENPPNAAIVLTEPKSADSDVIVVTLANPVYDAVAQTLVYDAKPLKNTEGTGLAFWGKRSDKALPSSFSKVSVFIDDCPDGPVRCYGNYEYGGQRKCRTACGVLSKKVGYCWSITHPTCAPCRNHVNECKAKGAPCVNSADPACTARACSTTPDCM